MGMRTEQARITLAVAMTEARNLVTGRSFLCQVAARGLSRYVSPRAVCVLLAGNKGSAPHLVNAPCVDLVHAHPAVV